MLLCCGGIEKTRIRSGCHQARLFILGFIAIFSLEPRKILAVESEKPHLLMLKTQTYYLPLFLLILFQIAFVFILLRLQVKVLFNEVVEVKNAIG